MCFRPVKFAWYPRWMLLLLLPSLLLGGIVIVASTRRVQGVLPFSEPAWRRWKRGQAIFAVACLAAVALFITWLVLLASSRGTEGLPLLIAALALPFAAHLGVVKPRGPAVVRIQHDLVTLKLPSSQAAASLRSSLEPTPRPPAAARGQ